MKLYTACLSFDYNDFLNFAHHTIEIGDSYGVSGVTGGGGLSWVGNL